MALALTDFVDLQLEREVIRTLIEQEIFDTEQYILSIREEFVEAPQHKEILLIIKALNQKGLKMSAGIVRAEMLSRGLILEPLRNILLVEPTPELKFSIEALEELQKKRIIFKMLNAQLEDLKEKPSKDIALTLTKTGDSILFGQKQKLKSYAELKEEFRILPPITKTVTGIPFLDSKLNGGLEDGQFVLVMGDPDAGKTLISTQIIKRMSWQNKVLFLNHEFSTRAFIDRNSTNEDCFNINNFFIDNSQTDLKEVEIQIKSFAREGGKAIIIDSQMMITNHKNKGTSEERETEKFFILSRLALDYNLIVLFICQQGKDDTKGGVIVPKSSKNGAHFAHQIWYISKEAPEFDEEGQDKHKFDRTFIMYKNKQSSNYFAQAMRISNEGEFRQSIKKVDISKKGKSTSGGKPQVKTYDMPNIN